MSSPKRAYRLIAILATLLLHGILFVGLYYLSLVTTISPKLPTKEITLIPVGMYGRGELAGGGINSNDPAPNPPRQKETLAPTSSSSKSEKEIMTQNNETPTLDKTSKIKAKRENEAEQIKKQKQREQEIENQMAGAFGKGKISSPKNDKGAGDGGSSAIGAGFSLIGRSIEGSGGVPVRPQGFPPTRGTVVVKIVVNNLGKVIDASVRLKGTNVTSMATQRAAIRAARQTLFNRVDNAPNQEGTIIYHFDVE